VVGEEVRKTGARGERRSRASAECRETRGTPAPEEEEGPPRSCDTVGVPDEAGQEAEEEIGWD